MRNIRTVRQLLFRIVIRPLFPFAQWIVLSLGLVKGPNDTEPDGRQPFYLRHLAPNESIESIVALLVERGFFGNRIAFTDRGQVASLRRLDEKDPTKQYHVRIFADGELRGESRPHRSVLERNGRSGCLRCPAG